MPSREFVSGIALRLDAHARHVLGPSGATRGKYLEKAFVGPIAGAAEASGISGEPHLILPVWVGVLPTPEHGPSVSVPKPNDGVIACWKDAEVTLLAYEDRRSTEVIGFLNGSSAARVVEFQKKKTVVPGLLVSSGSEQFALGTRNAISVGTSWTDQAKPIFAELATRLSGE